MWSRIQSRIINSYWCLFSVFLWTAYLSAFFVFSYLVVYDVNMFEKSKTVIWKYVFQAGFIWFGFLMIRFRLNIAS